MIAKIKPSVLCGTITVPPSKSLAHRALICGFLAQGKTEQCAAFSEDIAATQQALAALANGNTVLDCRESGSTLRFLIPVAAALGKSVTFVGSGRLPERPIGEYLRLLPAHGVACQSEGGLPLTIQGVLQAGTFLLPGDISSQYISGLLFALPLLANDSEIILTSPLQSEPYVAMTIAVLRTFGIVIEKTATGYAVRGGQQYIPHTYTIEGDWSQAAFFLAAGAIGGDITVSNLRADSLQGDKAIVAILKRFGARIDIQGSTVRAVQSDLQGCCINVSDIPDTVPALAVVAAFAKGKTVITGGERLRLKESDRIESVVANLRRMGVKAHETPEGMVIEGGAVQGAALEGCRDHRIVMAFSMAALYAQGATTITQAESVAKSYPHFFEDYHALGGKADVIHDR